MITCPCNENPLTPHFYIVKLGFTGVYIISEAVLMCTHNLCFVQKYENSQNISTENFIFTAAKIAVYCMGVFCNVNFMLT